MPAGAPFRDQVDIFLIVFFTEKGLLPAITPLSNMMGRPGTTTRAILAILKQYTFRSYKSRIKYGVPKYGHPTILGLV
jgi:hypothetical protein